MNKQSKYPRTGLLGWLNVLKWEGMREVDRVNERRVNLLAILWAASLVGATALVQFLDIAAPLSWMIALLPVATGFSCMRAYLKMLREADEMLRQMQFEAMAVGFGTGLILGMATLVVDLPSPWMPTVILVSMCVAFTLRVILAARELAREAQAEGEQSE